MTGFKGIYMYYLQCIFTVNYVSSEGVRSISTSTSMSTLDSLMDKCPGGMHYIQCMYSQNATTCVFKLYTTMMSPELRLALE